MTTSSGGSTHWQEGELRAGRASEKILRGECEVVIGRERERERERKREREREGERERGRERGMYMTSIHEDVMYINLM